MENRGNPELRRVPDHLRMRLSNRMISVLDLIIQRNPTECPPLRRDCASGMGSRRVGCTPPLISLTHKLTTRPPQASVFTSSSRQHSDCAPRASWASEHSCFRTEPSRCGVPEWRGEDCRAATRRNSTTAPTRYMYRSRARMPTFDFFDRAGLLRTNLLFSLPSVGSLQKLPH